MQFIEYIQSTGTQYINTGITPTTDSSFEITLSDVQSTGAQYGEVSIFGAGYYANNRYLLTKDGGGASPIVWYYPSKRRVVTDITSKHTIEIYRGSITVDGVVVSSDTSIGSTTFGNVTLFNVAGQYYSAYKLYEFKIFENNVLVFHGVPCLDDSDVACLYDEVSGNYFYNAGSGTFTPGPVVVIGHRFLIESNGDYYTISNNVLTNIGSTLNAQLFEDYGLLNIPQYSAYSTLTNPSILCWDNDSEIPMTANVDGVPAPQVVYSQNIDMNDSTITGIDSVDITSDDDTLFAMSFDNGSTWWNYVSNQWVLLNTDTAGQTKDDIEAISTSAWALKVSNQIKFRFVLADTNAYVTKIQVNFTN